jgi:hypothetical protein
MLISTLLSFYFLVGQKVNKKPTTKTIPIEIGITLFVDISRTKGSGALKRMQQFLFFGGKQNEQPLVTGSYCFTTYLK